MLLQYYPHKLNKCKLNKYKRYILEFLCNHNRKSTVISCKSNHKKILDFCTNYNIVCEQFDDGYKKIRACPHCCSRKYFITYHNYFYEAYCDNCNYYTGDWSSSRLLKEASVMYVRILKIKINKL